MDPRTIEYETLILARLLVTPAAAQALLAVRFNADDEERMRDLMEKNNHGTITEDEHFEMEAFRRVGSFLAVAHAKARLQLKLAAENQPSTA
jgi:hypothetical protein